MLNITPTKTQRTLDELREKAAAIGAHALHAVRSFKPRHTLTSWRMNRAWIRHLREIERRELQAATSAEREFWQAMKQLHRGG